MKISSYTIFPITRILGTYTMEGVGEAYPEPNSYPPTPFSKNIFKWILLFQNNVFHYMINKIYMDNMRDKINNSEKVP